MFFLGRETGQDNPGYLGGPANNGPIIAIAMLRKFDEVGMVPQAFRIA